MSIAYRNKHAPALMVRLPNRRVIGRKMPDGTIAFKFHRLVERQIDTQSIRMTPDALLAMLSIAKDFRMIGGAL